MTSGRFTPGPWSQSHEADGTYFVVRSGGPDAKVFSACECCDGVNLWAEDKGERDANAALIAASPKLYAFVERFVARGGYTSDELCAMAREAEALLAEARGEQ